MKLTRLQTTIQSINTHMSPQTFIFNMLTLRVKKIQPVHCTGNTLVMDKKLQCKVTNLNFEI